MCVPWQVHSEKYVAPYNGGVELAGCGGGMPPFATKPRVVLDELKSSMHGSRSSLDALHLTADQEGQLRPGTGPSTFDG